LTGFPLDLGPIEGTVTVADDFGAMTGSVADIIDLGLLATVSPHSITAQLLIGTLVDLGLVTGFASVSDDFGSVNDSVEDVIDLGTTP